MNELGPPPAVRITPNSITIDGEEIPMVTGFSLDYDAADRVPTLTVTVWAFDVVYEGPANVTVVREEP